MNLVEKLKNCPKGTKLYSLLHGIVEFEAIKEDTEYPIIVKMSQYSNYFKFTKQGKFSTSYEEGDCLLFPSKENRDWSTFKVKKSKFDPRTLKPFDKVLVNRGIGWHCDLFSYYSEEEHRFGCVTTGGYLTVRVVPYNNKTKHLIGTYQEAPEYYKYWED